MHSHNNSRHTLESGSLSTYNIEHNIWGDIILLLRYKKVVVTSFLAHFVLWGNRKCIIINVLLFQNKTVIELT